MHNETTSMTFDTRFVLENFSFFTQNIFIWNRIQHSMRKHKISMADIYHKAIAAAVAAAAE